jgi:hypothetical protein
MSKIECNNAFSIMHWIVSGSFLVISDVFIIVWKKTCWDGKYWIRELSTQINDIGWELNKNI